MPIRQEERPFTSLHPLGTTIRIVTRRFWTLWTLVFALTVVGVRGSAHAQNADPTRVLMDLPGFDFSRLTAAAKKELVTVLTDEFDACGRPLTLLASLKKGDACKHTKRLVGYAASQASEGKPATELINALARYGQTFSGKRAKLTVDERQCTGPKDAKITLVEFSDFECPYCNAARAMIEDVLKARPEVRLCYALFPLQGHANAMVAGQAALFARDAGKFMPMYHQLFDNQLSLSEGFIRQLIKKVGLDEKAYDKALAEKRYVDELNASKEAGKNGGVDSTPTVFVNGRRLTLPFSVESLLLAIDDEIDWNAGNASWNRN
jgi:protein-disulfide isomerase